MLKINYLVGLIFAILIFYGKSKLNFLFSIIFLISFYFIFKVKKSKIYIFSGLIFGCITIILFNLNSYNGYYIYKGKIGNNYIFNDGKVIIKESINKTNYFSYNSTSNKSLDFEIGYAYKIEGEKEDKKYDYRGITSIYKNYKIIDKRIHTLSYIRNEILTKIDSNLKTRLGEVNGALVTSLCLGLKDNDLYDINIILKSLGIIHILSISGFHINLLEKYLKKIKLQKYSFFIILTYSIIIDTIPSYRSMYMKISEVLAKKFEVDSDVSNNMIFAIIIQLMLNPSFLYNYSFILTYLSTMGIIYFSKYVEAFILKYIIPITKRRSWINDISLSIAALFTTTPIIATISPYFNIITFVSNLIVVPLYSILVLYSFVLIVFCLLLPWNIPWIVLNKIFYIIIGVITLLEAFLNKFSYYIPLNLNHLIYIFLTYLIISTYLIKEESFNKYYFKLEFVLLLLFIVNIHPGIYFVSFSKRYNDYQVIIDGDYKRQIFVNGKNYKKDIRMTHKLIEDKFYYNKNMYLYDTRGNSKFLLVKYKGIKLNDIINKNELKEEIYTKDIMIFGNDVLIWR